MKASVTHTEKSIGIWVPRPVQHNGSADEHRWIRLHRQPYRAGAAGDGPQVMVFDDFSDSSPIALERVRELAGPAAATRLRQMRGDIRNTKYLEKAFTKAPSGIDAVTHFAELKAVEESVQHLCATGM